MQKAARVLALAALLALCAVQTDAATPAFASVAEAAAKSNETTVLNLALQATGLDKVLADPEFVATIFAPTDAAFQAALEALDVSAEDLLANVNLTTSILSYHVVPGAAVLSTDLTDGAVVPTLLAGPEGEIKVDLSDPAAPKLITSTNQTVGIEAVDITAGKAVIHLIDAVLLPEGLL